jgi:hypothetical protein
MTHHNIASLFRIATGMVLGMTFAVMLLAVAVLD